MGFWMIFSGRRKLAELERNLYGLGDPLRSAFQSAVVCFLLWLGGLKEWISRSMRCFPVTNHMI